MRPKKNIKEIKAQLSANRKKLDEINHPNKRKSLNGLNKNRLKQTIQDEEQELKEFEQETLKQDETKQIASEQKTLKQALSKLKKKVKKKKKNHNIMIISTIILPIIMIIVLFLMSIWLLITININQATAVIAGLADPHSRTIMKAQGLLKESDETTSISQSMLGNLPDGFSVVDSDDNKSNNDNENSSISNVTGDMSTINGRAKIVTMFMKKNTTATAAQIAGLLGNWEHESAGIKSLMAETYYQGVPKDKWKLLVKSYGDPKYAALPISINSDYGNGHGGYTIGIGLGQWTGSRGYNLIKYGNADPDKVGDINLQLEFMIKSDKRWGFNGSKDWWGWKGGKNDPSTAALEYVKSWEGLKYDNGTFSTRQANARKWYTKVKSWMND